MNLKRIAGCAVLVLALTAGASAQGWFEECRDFSGMPPAAQYSADYGVNTVANGLFGAAMGVSGTSAWGGPQGFPCWQLRTLDAAGRLAFFMGGTGSVQSSFDDGLALTTGAPTDPVGDFCYAMITKDTNEPGGAALFGDGGLQLAFVGASNRYMVGGWSDADVQVRLVVRSIGDAAALWWDITNLGTEARPFGLLFAAWVGMHTSFGQFDSQTGATHFFFTRQTNFSIGKLTQDNFTGYFVMPTTRPVRNDYRLPRTSNRFPSHVMSLAGQTEAYGMRITNVPDSTMSKLVHPETFTKATASTADLMRVGNYSNAIFGNNISFNVFGDPTGTQEEADIFVLEHAVAQRYPIQLVQPGQSRRIVQVLKSSWGVSDYNDPYAAVVDAPKLINFENGGQDDLSPNPMTIRAYIDNQYAVLDQEAALQSVRFVLTLPAGLSLAPGETAEKNIGQVLPNAIAFVEWEVESDGVTFGNLPISVTFDPAPLGPASTKTLSTSIRVAATPIMRLAAGAQLVTFPYDFTDNSIGAILGLTPEIDFRAFRWEPGQGAYLQASVANRGEGLWIVPLSDEGFVALNNAATPPDTPNGGLIYTLKRGWNLIGNPYNYAVPLAELVAIVDDSPEQTYVWSSLVSNGFVSSALAYWDRGTSGAGVGSYKFTTSASTMLEPHKGYWIYVNTFNPVHIVWPPVLIPHLSNSGRADETVWRQSEKQWRVQLSARTGSGFDTDNYVGYVSDPTKVNKLAMPKPPKAQDTPVEVVLEGTMNGESTRMAQVLTNTKTKTDFKVHVNSTETGDVTLTWPNLGSVPRNVRAKITDVATGETRDMRSTSGYTYFMQQAGSREFTITLEQGGSVRPVIGNVVVDQAGGRGDSPITVRYALSADALVSVRVLSGSGKEVFTVTRGRADNAGENEVIWSLRDNANRAVAPGTYKVEILAETPDGDRVRKVVPVNVIR